MVLTQMVGEGRALFFSVFAIFLLFSTQNNPYTKVAYLGVTNSEILGFFLGDKN